MNVTLTPDGLPKGKIADRMEIPSCIPSSAPVTNLVIEKLDEFAAGSYFFTATAADYAICR